MATVSCNIEPSATRKLQSRNDARERDGVRARVGSASDLLGTHAGLVLKEREMPRSARLVTLVTLIGLSIWLHCRLCFWGSQAVGSPNPRVLAWGEEYSLGQYNGPPVRAFSGRGLFARQGVGLAEAATLGVALPIGLLATSAVLWLRWRQDDRIVSGRCVRCGHRLDGPSQRTCPECGWAASRL